MIRAELRSLLSRKLRTALTIIAIVLGVSMISGTYVLTDTINAAFDSIFSQAQPNIGVDIIGKAAVSGLVPGSPSVPASLLATVRHVRGVRAADGEIADRDGLALFGQVRVNAAGKATRPSLSSQNGPPTILFGIKDQKFNALTLTSGSWPTGYQVTLDDETMSRNNLKLGETVYVVTASHKIHPFTIVGTTRYGSASTLFGATLIEMSLPVAQSFAGLAHRYDQIAVIDKKGYSQARVAAYIRTAIPKHLRNTTEVQTAKERRAANENELGTILKFLTIALLAFAGVAVFVGAFIIFNTFSITVAQRAREFALFRTLGASRGQVLRSVIIEALLVGIAASIIGLLAGLAIAVGLNGLFKAVGADLPAGSLVMAPRTVIVSVVVGTLITLVSALVPAIRATRVAPVAAMREGAALPKGRLSKLTPIFAVVVVALGIIVTVGGVFGSISATGTRLLIIGLGCVLLFLGVAMLSPLLVRPLASIVGWPFEQLTNIAGRIARENAVRNPSRTAVTAAALMIGLALVGFVTVFAAELKATTTDAVNREVAGDFIIQNAASDNDVIPLSAERGIGNVPGVSFATGLSEGLSRVRGIGKQRVDAVDPAGIANVYNFQWVTGSNSTLTHMRSQNALIDDSFEKSHHLRLGSRLKILTPTGSTDTFTVTGVYKSSQLLDSVVVPLSAFRRDWHDNKLFVLAVNANKHLPLTTVENSIANYLEVHEPLLTVSSQAQYKAQADDSVNGLLALIYVLLGLSIVVSLFGIINTLILSIYERTREIGMLRAIGTTRAQVRWIIRWESVITSLIGAVLGLVLGVALAFLITLGLQSYGIEYALPVAQLLLFVVLAIFFGIAAAALPARRAARLDVLQALAYE